MDFFKIIIIIFALLLGIFGQRFQRHSSNDNSQNNLDVVDNSKKLASDVNTFLITESREYEIELLNGELKFEMCTSVCNNDLLIFCFDSDEPKTVAGSNRCPNQCEVHAGFQQIGADKVAHFSGRTSSYAVTKQCDIVTMQSPATTFF
uniref:Uncharacterized protein n=1 Tax=Panagrolaimus superbus TaxID=310955 RepID=A0A914YGE0_9BILA